MPKQEIEAKLKKMMPTLSGTELDILKTLPEEYFLQVPLHIQEQKHFCGAACVQMLQGFYGDPVMTQEQIAHYSGWSSWRMLNHESFAEDADRFLARLNFLPATYYPGAFILRHFNTGPEGGDFILSNREVVSELDFTYFKMLLKSINGPTLYRIHFTTEEYPMDEEMAQKLDNSGHCLLMTGWTKRGFLFNDPWDREQWGGSRGGKDVEIPYEVLTHIRPLVNCCKDGSHSVSRLQAALHESRQAVSQGREVDLQFHVRWPGIVSLMERSYKVTNLSARLYIPDHFELRSESIQESDQILSPGKEVVFAWKVFVGSRVASFPLCAEAKGSLELPAWNWEEHAKRELITVRGKSHIRLDVKSEKWFNAYGRF